MKNHRIAITGFVVAMLTTMRVEPSPTQMSQQGSYAEVQTLLKTKAKDDGIETGKYESDFFKALLKLAERQNVNPKTFTQYQSGSPARSGVASSTLTEGEGVEVKLRKNRYITAILSALPLARPDTSVQQLILFDQSGRYLDKIACAINSRYGVLRTDVSNDPEKDGAHFIVRFHADSLNKGRWHNWHTITYGGKAYTFYVPEREPQPTKWTKNGLCRIAVKDGKFIVAFPKLEKSDGEVLKETIGK